MRLRYLFVFLVILLASCATANSRRERFVSSNPGLTPEQREAIVRGDITAGMTPEMVKASWGAPLDEIKELLGGREVTSWLYQWPSDNLLKTFRVRFVDGQVDEVKLINVQERVYSPFYRRYYWRYYPEWTQ